MIPLAVGAFALSFAPDARAQEPPDDPPGTSSPPPPEPRVRHVGVVLGGGFPRLFGVEGLLRRGSWAFGASFESTPPSLLFSTPKTSISWHMIDVQARWFVYRFVFVGAQAGWQYVRTDSSNFGSEVDYVVTSANIGLRAGVLHTFPSGLAVGGDLGVTHGLFPSLRRASEKGEEDSNARKVARTFGEFPIPYMGARVGYFF